VFIYHIADDPDRGEAAARVLRVIEEGEEAATSALAISQVCGYLGWRRREDVIPLFLEFVRSLPTLLKVETGLEDFLEAEEASRLGLSLRMWDDLAIAVQMRRLGIEEVYSNDGDFNPIPWVGRVF